MPAMPTITLPETSLRRRRRLANSATRASSMMCAVRSGMWLSYGPESVCPPPRELQCVDCFHLDPRGHDVAAARRFDVDVSRMPLFRCALDDTRAAEHDVITEQVRKRIENGPERGDFENEARSHRNPCPPSVTVRAEGCTPCDDYGRFMVAVISAYRSRAIIGDGTCCGYCLRVMRETSSPCPSCITASQRVGPRASSWARGLDWRRG